VARDQYGIGLELPSAMMTSAPKTPTNQTNRQSPQRLLAWTFRRGAQFLTCEVLCTVDQQYAVVVTPHWSSGTTLVEERANGVNAFHRHADLAMQLRQQGWTVAAYAPLPAPRTPAPQAYQLAA
jgi:hypothetical protein